MTSRFVFSILEGNKSEWGYEWVKLNDGTMGQTGKPIINDLDDIKNYSFPKLCRDCRIEGLDKFKQESQDRYLLAGLGLSGFTAYTFIRGFDNALMDFALEDSRASELLDAIIDFECRIITLAAELGFDGVHFEDDWGTQSSLIVSPALWRKIFRPRYHKQVKLAHELSMDVWFHSCGNIAEIIPDLHEIGVDVINVSQPNVVDTKKVGMDIKGKQCFMAPISYQTVSITGTCEDIMQEAKRLYNDLGTPAGGFIGYVEEYSCMGMSERNFKACGQSFRELL